MSVLLSLVSGAVNALAIIVLGGTVAHHTGNASHLGRLMGTGATPFAVLMVSYLVGAAVPGFTSADGEAIYARRYSPSLLGAALIVLASGFVYEGSGLVALSLLSISQGIQNCISRKCGSMPLCTTHMTGYLTDAGSDLGAWMAGGRKDPVPVRTKLFLASIIAFIGGGYVAMKSLDTFGVKPTLASCALVMAAAAVGLVPLPSSAGSFWGKKFSFLGRRSS